MERADGHDRVDGPDDREAQPPGTVAPAVLAVVASVLDAPVVVARGADDPVVAWVSAAFVALAGPAAAGVVGQRLSGLLDGSSPALVSLDREGPAANLTQLLGAPGRVSGELPLRRPDGSSIAVRALAVPVVEGGQRWWVLILSDGHGSGSPAEELRASEERFLALAGRAPVGVLSSEVGVRLGYVNPHLARIAGVSEDDLLGVGWLSCLLPEDVDQALAALQEALEGREAEAPRLRWRRPDGQVRTTHLRVVPVRTPGQGAGFVASLEDITDHRSLQALLTHQAHHDGLTGLPNRTLLRQRLDSLLARSTAPFAVYLVDLDDFRLVTDSLGRALGDRLLQLTAERLSTECRLGDLVARVGGDEFVVVCDDVSDPDDARVVALRLLGALATPLSVDGRSVAMTASIGVALSGGDAGGDADAVLRDADVALHDAKRQGLGRYALFDERLRAHAQDYLALVGDLRRALEQGGLSLDYQPIVDLVTGAATAVEALVRWRHPERGVVGPDRFVPAAERSGLVVPLGAWVLRTACAQLVTWRRQLGSSAPRYVAVNLSAVQLDDPDLPDLVAAALAEAGLDGADLCLELTESVLMSDPLSSVQALDQLKALGVRLAIDDFGTGYSSLAYLSRFPVDEVKVDQAFVAALDQPDGTAIVAAVTALGHALGLHVVAEGVETAEQEMTLRRLGCAYGQGFHLGRPAAPDVIAAQLRGPGKVGAGR